MIKLFKSTDTEFKSNGDKIIKPLKAQVYKEDNGDFFLDLETDLSFINDLTAGAILVAPTPNKEQAFRISKIQKTRMKIIVKAYHVYYDTKNYLVEDTYLNKKDCDFVIRYLNQHTDNKSPFIVDSNIKNIESFRCEKKSLYEAIQIILEKWGGHLVRDNFNISIKSDISKDNGVEIRYAKNLKELTSDENWDNVVTKLLPVGKDGILLNHMNNDEDVYINAPTNYKLPYTKVIHFSQDIDKNDFKIEQEQNQPDNNGQNNRERLDEQAYISALIADLKSQAQKHILKHCIPEINYTLKANSDKITDIGNIIRVIDNRLGIDILAHVTSFKYDCILKKYVEIAFGNIKHKTSNLIDFVMGKCSGLITRNTHDTQARINAIDETFSSDINFLQKNLTELSTKIKGSILTAKLSETITNLAENINTVLTLHSIEQTSDLIMGFKGICINNNVYQIKISAMVSYEAKKASGNRTILIIKNDFRPQNILATTTNYLIASQRITISIAPITIRVRKSDIIYLCYLTPQKDDIIYGHNNNNLTYLTVEIIK